MSTNRNHLYRPAYRTSWALVIGINQYKHVSPLEFARNDAEGVAAVLKSRFGFAEQNIVLLVDEDATRDAITSAFLRFTDGEMVDSDDRVLVFFAGHGVTQSGRRGEVGFLVPVDGDARDLATLIRWDELTRNGDLIPAKHLLYVMDACYGGLAVTRHTPVGSMRFLKDMMQRYARQVLTAGKADEAVADGGGPRAGHSVFTGHLLDALEGAAAQRKGVLTANAVMAYVYDRVGRDQFSNQTPHFGFLDGDGDFVFDLAALEALDGDPQMDSDLLVPSAAAENRTDIRSEQPPVVELAKEYLPDPRYRIKLHDLMFSALRETIRRTGEGRFSLEQPEPAAESFTERLKLYEDAISPMRELWTLLSTWGEGRDQLSLLESVITQLVPQGPGDGKTVWIELRWYPVMLMLYSGGVGALSQENYATLRSMLKAPVGNELAGGRPSTLIESVVMSWLRVVRTDVFKALPGHERQHVPDKEYLFKITQPVVEDLLFLGRRYEPLFDRFEALVALVYGELLLARENRVWGPPGRFTWKYSHHAPNDPFSDLLKEAERAKDGWAPIRAGLFVSYESFRTVAEAYRQHLLKLGWF